MADEVVENEVPYPNNLRAFREKESLTRLALKQLCDELAQTDPIRYKGVGLTTLRDLELGLSQPKMRTASTISGALNRSTKEIFPLGIESPYKNPSGNTSITPGRMKGGRKPKEK